jgi:hypothetical protein
VYLLCTYVGLVRPTKLSRTQRRPRTEAGPTIVKGPSAAGGPPSREANKVLRRVEHNLTTLTHTIPMDEIEDLPPSM